MESDPHGGFIEMPAYEAAITQLRTAEAERDAALAQKGATYIRLTDAQVRVATLEAELAEARREAAKNFKLYERARIDAPAAQEPRG